MARPTPAYFECNQSDCSLQFAVKMDLDGRPCERLASGFYSPNEGFEKISALLRERGKLQPNKIYQADLSFACRFLYKQQADDDGRSGRISDPERALENLKMEQALSSFAADCAEHSKVMEIDLDKLGEAKIRWQEEIKANHLNQTARFFYLFLGMEVLFWVVRRFLPSRLFGLSILFLFLPLAHLTLAPAGGLHFNLTYLLWPILWLRTTIEGLHPDQWWRRATHMAGLILCLLLLGYLFYQAYASAGLI